MIRTISLAPWFNWPAIQRRAGDMLRRPGETVASRPLDPSAVGPTEFMGNAVETADHGAAGIEAAQPIPVDRAHDPNRRAGVIGFKGFPGNGFRLIPQRLPLRCRLPMESLAHIKVFGDSVVMKPGQTAVVLAPPALESTLAGDSLVFAVHIGKEIRELFHKRRIALSPGDGLFQAFFDGHKKGIVLLDRVIPQP
jgi:hypothetical protein